MNRIASPERGGKYDDAIEWLQWLEKALTAWRDGKMVKGAVYRLNEFSRHEHAIVFDANTFNWSAARIEDKKRTMKWIPAGEAALDLISCMERQFADPPTPWDEHIENVKACLKALRENNPPAENPIKY